MRFSTLIFCARFSSSGALIRGGNSILQINSDSRRKLKSKTRLRSINTVREDFRAVLKGPCHEIFDLWFFGLFFLP